VVRGDKPFHDFNPNVVAGLQPADLVEPDGRNVATFKMAIGQGRRTASMFHHARNRIRMPFGSFEDKRKDIYSRGYLKQGERYDEKIRRDCQGDAEKGYHDYQTVTERINNDGRYRLYLAREIVNVQANFSPPQILLSRYCRQAFELCLANGELNRENIGERKRKIREETED
jgi:hypothetical protein